MSIEAPRFELKYVRDDGSEDEARIVPVTQIPWATQSGRRGFLGAGLTCGAAMVLLGGCDRKQPKKVSQGFPTPDWSPPRRPPPPAQADPNYVRPEQPSGASRTKLPLKAHKSGISRLAVSADGTAIVSSGSEAGDGAKVWLMPEATVVPDVGGYAIWHLHPDGGRLVAYSGGDVELRSVPDGTLEQSWTRKSLWTRSREGSHRSDRQAVAMTADGDCIVAMVGGVVLLPLGQRGPAVELEQGACCPLIVSPDGRVLIAGECGGGINLWSLPNGDHLGTLGSGAVAGLVVAPDGRHAAVAWDRGGLDVWSLDDVRERVRQGRASATREYERRQRVQTTFVSGSADGTVRIWSLAGQSEVISWQAHGGAVTSTAVTADGMALVTAGKDNLIKFWSFPEGKELSTLEGRTSRITDLAVTADGSALAVAAGSRVKLWSLPDRRPLPDLPKNQSVVRAVAASPDGKALAWANGDKIALQSQGGRSAQRVFAGHTRRVEALVFTPTGKQLVSASADTTVRVWPVFGHAHPLVLKGHRRTVTALAVSPDGKLLASGSIDGTVRLWDLLKGQLLHTLEGATDRISSMAIMPGGEVLVTGCWDHQIRLWSLAEGRLLETRRGHTDKVTAIAGPPLPNMLPKPKPSPTPTPEVPAVGTWQSDGQVSKLAMTPTGKILITGSRDGTVGLREMPGAERVADLKGHRRAVTALALSPDGSILASGSNDKTIRLWSLDDRSLLGILEGHQGEIRDLAVMPDGHVLVSGDSLGVIILWSLDDRSVLSYLYDPAANLKGNDGVAYNVFDNALGRMVTYTMPCGSPIPEGATCTCNCVPGAIRSRKRTGTGDTFCKCVPVCTCVPVTRPR